MRTCDTCKFWGPDSYGGYIAANGDIKERIHHDCKCPKLRECDEEDSLCDNADYDYGISTGPKFGGIHHTIK